MRDILVTVIVFGSIPYIFKKPYFGIIMWVWISVMNLHRQGWGFARTFPFAAAIAVVTLLSMLLSKEKKALPSSPVTVIFILFTLWMSVTSLFAIHPDQVSTQWIRVYKIMGMTLVTMMLIKDKRQIEELIWMIVISLGFYGVKGGIFTIRSGGADRVWGPEGTFIDGNNEIALALIMVIPLMYYLHSVTKNKWGRYAFVASMLLCALAALGSYSRGAAIAIVAMVLFLWLKSRSKMSLGVLIIVVAPLMLMVMPSKWFTRIDTIDSYQQDSSAMGRINAWQMATNLAIDRPLTGGGFEIYDPGVFLQYAPNPYDVHAAHSIYFQALGEHGFVGLFLYLTLGFLTWRSGSWVIKNTSKIPDLRWAYSLATMLQVSLLGFAVGGAFLSLLYFDVPYYLMAAMVALKIYVQGVLKEEKSGAAANKPQPISLGSVNEKIGSK